MAYTELFLKLLQGILILILGPLTGRWLASMQTRSPHTDSSPGIAFSLSAWVTPAILRRENTSKSAIAQFSETIDRGMRYLQPSGRLVGLLMLLVTVLTSQHPDPAEAWKWKLYGAAFLAVIQVALWEVYFIFPINDTITAMGARFEGNEEQSLPEAEQKRLVELLLQWEFRHRVRIAMPFVACIVAVVAVLI